MSRWFRFYDDAVNDPKVQRLPGEKFKVWVNLLCLASRNEGQIPSLEDLVFILRVTRDEMSKLLDEFCDVGLIDPIEVRDAPMSYEPHNWKERQYISDTKDPTAAKRAKKYRDAKRDAAYRDRDGTVSVTATRTDTESETDKISRVPALVFESDWPKVFREAFWQLYPKRTDKVAAFKKLEQLRRSGGLPWKTLIDGVQRYAESVRGKDPKFTKGPAAWLSAGKWDDEIAPGNSVVLPGGQRLEGWV